MSDVEVKVGADTGELESGLGTVTSKMREALSGMDSNMASTMAMGTALGSVIGEVLVGAVEHLAEAMQETITKTVEFREEADSLGRKLGTTATNANDIAAALGNIYVSTDEYTSAAKGMEKILNTNEASLKKLGITTRDVNGNLRPLNDLMLDGIKVVNDHKAGIDRNITSTQIFGKAIQDGSRLLELNKQRISEGTAENERYGLVVGVEAVEDLENFKAAHDDVNDSIMGMRNAVGNALLPVLTKFSEWFAYIAPAAILVLKGVIGGIVSVFWGLKLSAEIVWNSIAYAVEATGAQIMRFARTAEAALTGDFAGATAAWDKGTKAISDIADKRFGAISDAAADTQEKLRRLFDDQTAIAPKAGDGGIGAEVKPPKTPKEKKDHSEIPAMKALLDAKIEAEKGYFQDSLQLEIDFWIAKKNLSTTSADDKAKIEHMVYQLNKNLAHENLADQLETLKQQAAAEGQAGAERVRLAHAATVLIAANYGLESKEYKKAMMDEVAAMTEANNAILKMDAIEAEARKNSSIAAIDLETEYVNQLKSMGEISDIDEINRLIKLEERKYQIEAKAAKASAELIVNDAVAKRAADAKALADAEKHELDMTKLRNKRVLLEKQAALNVAAATQSAMQRSFVGMMNGTMTFAQGMRNIFKGMADGVIGEIARMASEWIIQHTLMAIFGKKTASSEIATSAARAGAAGVASFAGAPWPIDMGAPAFGASMAGAAMAYQGLSAEGGFDIPAGVNPLVQTHQKEMILPAEHADTIRGLAGGKSGGNTFNISAVDAAGVKKFLMANGNHIADSLKAQARNFKVNNI